MKYVQHFKSNPCLLHPLRENVQVFLVRHITLMPYGSLICHISRNHSSNSTRLIDQRPRLVASSAPE